VFLTGASSGIGEALAKVFADEGAKLVLLARRDDRLQLLAKALETGGKETLVQKCDVTRDGDLEKAAEAARQRFGRIDVVVANAGFGIIGKLEKLSLEDYRRQFETNVFGVLRTVQATLPDLKKSRGRLVLMGSISGHIGTPQSSPYTMSKFAVHSLAESLYAELAPDGIAVTLISPGFVVSEIHEVDNFGIHHTGRGSAIPAWLKMPTDRAARQIVKAIYKKKREQVITFHGKILVQLKRHFPGLMDWVLRTLSKKLPKTRVEK
jgi:short-subunit dehydrogenase